MFKNIYTSNTYMNIYNHEYIHIFKEQICKNVLYINIKSYINTIFFKKYTILNFQSVFSLIFLYNFTIVNYMPKPSLCE